METLSLDMKVIHHKSMYPSQKPSRSYVLYRLAVYTIPDTVSKDLDGTYQFISVLSKLLWHASSFTSKLNESKTLKLTQRVFIRFHSILWPDHTKKLWLFLGQKTLSCQHKLTPTHHTGEFGNCDVLAAPPSVGFACKGLGKKAYFAKFCQTFKIKPVPMTYS